MRIMSGLLGLREVEVGWSRKRGEILDLDPRLELDGRGDYDKD